MSLKDKASRINFSGLPAQATHNSDVANSPITSRPKTAPGLMLAATNDQRSELLRQNEDLQLKVAALSESAARADELRQELAAWDNAKAARLLDPRRIRRSRWANRDPMHFQSAEFRQLKDEIASAGGNVQPIKVRPVAPSAGGDDAVEYEVVFGHRRHEACLELGLPVLAMVDNLSEVMLFSEMDRENRTRADLSPWEQGRMYRRALDEGLFPSNRKLAEAVGVDLSNLGKVLALASLPQIVVDAFPSPLEIQWRWGKPLLTAWQSDPEGISARAQAAKERNPRPTAKEVFRLLTDAPEAEAQAVQGTAADITIDGKVVGRLEMSASGAAMMTLHQGAITPEKLPGLSAVVQNYLQRRSGSRKGKRSAS